MLSYNISFHKSVLNTLHFITFGQDAQLPSFPAPDLIIFLTEKPPADDLQITFIYSRDLARRHNEDALGKY